MRKIDDSLITCAVRRDVNPNNSNGDDGNKTLVTNTVLSITIVVPRCVACIKSEDKEC